MATVWASSSLLVQVTVVPLLTVITAGLNAKLAMSTALVATAPAAGWAAAAAVGVAVTVAAGRGVEAAAGCEPPHAASATAAMPAVSVAVGPARQRLGFMVTSCGMCVSHHAATEGVTGPRGPAPG